VIGVIATLQPPSKRSTHEDLPSAYPGSTIPDMGIKENSMIQTKIAKEIGVHKSTLSREIKRNTGGRGYRPKQAHTFALQRRKEKARTRISTETWRQVDALIRKEWSSEQVSAHLFLEQGISVSHKWIYQHIY